MKVEVDVRGSPSLIVYIVPTVSADVKQYWTGIQTENRAQSCVKIEVDVLNTPPLSKSPQGLCGRKATVGEEADRECVTGTRTPSITFRHLPAPWRKDVVNQCWEFDWKSVVLP